MSHNLARRDFLKSVVGATAALTGIPIASLMEATLGTDEAKWIPLGDGRYFAAILSFECDDGGDGCQKIPPPENSLEVSGFTFSVRSSQCQAKYLQLRRPRQSRPLLDFSISPTASMRWESFPGYEIICRSAMFAIGRGSPGDLFVGSVIGRVRG